MNNSIAIGQKLNNTQYNTHHHFYPVDPMAPKEMCDLLVSKIDVHRIAFYGDSLTETQFNSFINLFGTAYIDAVGTLTPALKCPF